ncbi:MAG: hypothetical protein GXP17_06750 [Gammaproteobacteria bacterium]|nr:hypothetical protein [Gammaproteobacteria bacterium]
MKKQRAKILSLAFLILGASTGQATNSEPLGNLTQAQFKELTADLGVALSYKSVMPVEPLGALGFDLGFEVSSATLENDVLEAASSSDVPDSKRHLHKGLPLRMNLGAFYSSVPSRNIGLVGGALSYAVFEGDELAPAVSIRGTYSQLTGVDALELTTKGLEVSISKDFALFTPYVGVGAVRMSSKTNQLGLANESLTKAKKFLGFNLDLGRMNIAAETEKIGDNTSISAKIGLQF